MNANGMPYASKSDAPDDPESFANWFYGRYGKTIEYARADHLRSHDANVERRAKERHARGDRNKRRGLAAFVAGMGLRQ